MCADIPFFQEHRRSTRTVLPTFAIGFQGTLSQFQVLSSLHGSKIKMVVIPRQGRFVDSTGVEQQTSKTPKHFLRFDF